MKPRIERWYIHNNRVVGNVTGHPKFLDRTQIVTSPIEHISEEEGIVKTKNTTYQLGAPLLDTMEPKKK